MIFPWLGRRLVNGVFCLSNLVLIVVVHVTEVGGEFVQTLRHLAKVDELHGRLLQEIFGCLAPFHNSVTILFLRLYRRVNLQLIVMIHVASCGRLHCSERLNLQIA